MRVSALATVLLPNLMLSAGIFSLVGLTAVPVLADQAKAACSCDCPHEPKIRAHHAGLGRRTQGYAAYSYGDAAPVKWGMASHDAHLPGPAFAYAEPEGLVIDQRGWTGGVGYGEEGGGGGGYGQLLLANGNSQNGPTYNSFGESFQQSPMAHPFQSRLMGAIAPTK